jgi:hypothetical protein
MNRLNDLFRNLTVLNLALGTLILVTAGLVLFLAFGSDLGITASGSAEAVKVPAISDSAQAKGPEMKDYAVVAEQNLFHPERRNPADSKDEALQKPDVILYGTLITDSVKVAYLEDKKSPYSTPGRGPRQMMLRKGDKLSGYTLQEVEETQITLVKGGDKIVVRLESPDKRKSGEATAKPATGRPAVDRPPPPPSIMPAAPPATSPRPSVAPPAYPTAPSPSARPPATGPYYPPARDPRIPVQPSPRGGP